MIVRLLPFALLLSLALLPARAETLGEATAKLPSGASLAAAVEKARHAVRQVEGEPRHRWAQNPGHGLNARFTPEGLEMSVTVSNEDGTSHRHAVRWRTTAIGYGERLSPVPTGMVRNGSATGEGNHVEIVRPGLVEWFVNGKQGLEHGWTLSERPVGFDVGGPLRIEMELEGDLSTEISTAGDYVILRGGDGNEALRYSKLKVWDSEGKTLASRMVGGESNLAVEVEDAGAIYPLTVDPIFSRQAYLKASNPGTNDQFGESVAISGETVVIGAPWERSAATGVNGNQSDNSADMAGAAYVFVRSGSNWVQQAYLKASNADAGDLFGSGVAIDGDTIVVGAPGEESASTTINGDQNDNSHWNDGAAYIFVRNGTVWSQQAYIKDSTGVFDFSGGEFGESVAISGDTVVVGAPSDDGVVNRSGAAFVFVRDIQNTWSQQAYLKASNVGDGDLFGESVAIDGERVVVGAPGEDSASFGINGTQDDNNMSEAGAAYVFERDGTVWAQQAYLKWRKAFFWISFGDAVSVSGDTVAVGGGGETHIFTHSDLGWNRQAIINFGDSSISLDGDILAIGNHHDDEGKVYVRSGSTWVKHSDVNPGGGLEWRFYGWSVAVSGETVVVGAYEDRGAGASYIFKLGPAPARPQFKRLRPFRPTEVGRRSRPQVIRVTNAGDFRLSGLRVVAVGKASQDYILRQPSKKSLAHGEKTSFSVTFQPRRKGKRAAFLVARSNAPLVKIPLSGKGKTR